MVISETRTQNKMGKMKEEIKGKYVCLSKWRSTKYEYWVHTHDVWTRQKNFMVHHEQKDG